MIHAICKVTHKFEPINGTFEVTLNGKSVVLSKPQFSGVESAPNELLAEIRETVRRHGREWLRDVRFCFMECPDNGLNTEWRVK